MELLNSIRFGERIAEKEAQNLRHYFVTTEDWRRLFEGEVDIIYGTKGAGKSALYAVLDQAKESLFEKNILLTTAENPRGNTVFEGLVVDPPTSELEFVRIWKLYFLIITVEEFKQWGVTNDSFIELKGILEESNLVPARTNLRSILSAVRKYISQLINVESIQPGVDINDFTGHPSGVNLKITFREPSPKEQSAGIRSIDYLYELLDESLINFGYSLWIAVDRLDVAFTENLELETNALRALFKVYRDLAPYGQVQIKIFLRDDIWNRIVQEGFREANHITKALTISWTKESILNLIIRRLLNNSAFVEQFGINVVEVLSDYENQEKLFYTYFPRQIDVRDKKPAAIDWIISRIKDGNGVFAPREIIHLFNEAIKKQIKQIEIGQNELEGDWIISRRAFKSALEIVSKIRLEQTIYAEYPDLKQYIQKMQGEKTEQRLDSLQKIWDIGEKETAAIAQRLSDIGFFEERGDKHDIRYWIPFIYRNELSLVQGAAE